MGITKIDQIEKNFPEDEITNLYEQTKSQNAEDIKIFIETCKAKSISDGLKYRWGQVREMLFHLNDRVNYWENRRTQFLQIGLGLLGASFAGIIAVFANIKELTDVFIGTGDSYKLWLLTGKGLVYLFVFVLCCCFVIGSLILLHRWNCQNNPNYPFTKGYRFWLWHYRHAEQTPSDTKVSGYTPETFKQQVTIFCQNIAAYKKRFLQTSTEDLFDQDLSQTYLLLINEKYKIKMVSELREVLVKTVIIALFYVGLPVTVFFALLRIFAVL